MNQNKNNQNSKSTPVFTPIDRAAWARAEHYDHYMHTARCMHSTVVNIDVTALRQALKRRGLRAYPAQIWMLAAAVNRHAEFRMARDGSGAPGVWSFCHPSFTVLNRETETFSCLWTPWEEEFSAFYQSAVEVMDTRATGRIFPQGDMPDNLFDISSLPWVEFTSFHLSLYTEGTHLAPIFTLGKYVQQGDRLLLPLAIQIHHAACDGLHLGRFVETLQELAEGCEGWL